MSIPFPDRPTAAEAFTTWWNLQTFIDPANEQAKMTAYLGWMTAISLKIEVSDVTEMSAEEDAACMQAAFGPHGQG